MKRPLSWHIECYTNNVIAVRNRQLRIESDLARLAADQTCVEAYKHQIETAIAEGKGGFDRDKYLLNRKEKS